MNKTSWLKHFDFFILDLLCLLFSIVVSYFLRHHNLLLFRSNLYMMMCLIYTLSDAFFFFFLNPYSDVLKIGYLVELKRTVLFDILVTLASISFLFIIKSGEEYSRLTLFLTLIFYIVSPYVVRILWKRRIRQKARQTIKKGDKSLLIICRENEAEEIISRIKKNNYE